jgi:hypothetical protein
MTTTPPRPPREQRRCRCCDRPFQPRRFDHVYCSPKCKVTGWRERQADEAMDEETRALGRAIVHALAE